MNEWKAYRTTLFGVRSLVSAKNRGKAMLTTVLSARDAGYQCKYTEVKAVRANERDSWACEKTSGKCWDESLINFPPPTNPFEYSVARGGSPDPDVVR